MLVLSICLILLFMAFLLFKMVVPPGRGGWSILPAIDSLFFIAFMICLIGIGLGYTYRSWTMNADEYAEWLAAQQLVGASWTKFWVELLSPEYYLWSTRLMGPFVIAGALFLLVSITSGMIAGGIPPP
jgi:hypothetical protein